ncbi:MAG: helix-turn-helix transcriptional regulator [Candidatus Omnitrophica bacterium]|nr:helix-turn-helix transcriptional regulator [Candidatus Omnitrophota bacterium]
MKYKIESVNEHIKEQLKDPYFKELYELEQQKLGLVKKIIAYRVSNNITQEELADQVGVTQQHISKIENCEFTDPVTLAKVLLFVGFRVHMKAEPIRSVARKKIRRVIQKLAMA